MLFLLDGLQIAILLIGLLGIALGAEHYFPKLKFSFLLCAAPIGLIVLLFFLEHFIALGRPTWLYLPGLFLSLYLIRRRGPSLFRESSIWFFLIGFLFTLAWRFDYPDLIASIERIADHTFIIDYARGERLPPEDSWLKGEKVDMYYGLQYYGAAWISRALGASTGMAYNVGFCVLFGLATAAIGGGIRALTKSSVAAVIAIVGILAGGNGASLVVPFMTKAYSYWDSMLFIGVYAVSARTDLTAFGHWLVNLIGSCPSGVPMEYYAHTIVLGDYHPSLSSLLFLSLFILAVGLSEDEPGQSPMDRACVALACSTPILLLAANTWIAPLQLIAVIGWLGYRFFIGKKDSARILGICFLVPLALIFPFLSYFCLASQNYHLGLQMTAMPVPFLNWLMVMLPSAAMLLVCVILAFFQRLARYAVLSGLFFFVFTFFFHVQDYYGGIFNTSLKWWPWSYSLVMLLGFAIAWKYGPTRIVAVALTVLPVVAYLWISGDDLVLGDKKHMGRLDGSAWLRESLPQTFLLNYLNSLPRGVMLQGCSNFDPQGVATYAQFTPHYALGGWIQHELIWRGIERADMQHLADERQQFYQNKLPNPKQWLLDHQVDYVLWLDDPDNIRDNGAGATYWAPLNNQLEGTYVWHSFIPPDAPPNTNPLGVWVRNDK